MTLDEVQSKLAVLRDLTKDRADIEELMRLLVLALRKGASTGERV